MRLHKLWCCLLAVLALAALCAFDAAADTTVGVTGAGTFKMEQAYVNVPELDVYFYALNGDGDPYSGTDAGRPQARGTVSRHCQ